MNYLTGNWETIETAELLGELCYYEQLGYAGEVAVLELKMEIEKRFNAPKEAVQAIEEEEETKVISVFFEYGYKWSVDVSGEEESRDSSLTKKEAMQLARQLKRELGNAVINEQKLTRAERAENIQWLHENTELYVR